MTCLYCNGICIVDNNYESEWAEGGQGSSPAQHDVGKASQPEQRGEHHLDHVHQLGHDHKRDFEWTFQPGFDSGF